MKNPESRGHINIAQHYIEDANAFSNALRKRGFSTSLIGPLAPKDVNRPNPPIPHLTVTDETLLSYTPTFIPKVVTGNGTSRSKWYDLTHENVVGIIAYKDFLIEEPSKEPPYTLPSTQAIANYTAKYIEKIFNNPQNYFVNSQGETLKSGEFCLNLERNILRIAGKTIPFTTTESKMLLELMKNPGIIIPHDELFIAGQGDNELERGQRYHRAHIANIRRKLGPYAEHIETIKGKGIRFTPELQDQ